VGTSAAVVLSTSARNGGVIVELPANGSIMITARLAETPSRGLVPLIPASAVRTSSTGSLLHTPPSTTVNA
jgi:hypothetical protein